MKPLSERYSLGARIGRGGVGEVFRGWQTALERPVAIKLLRRELMHHASVVARFKQEARNTCRLHHPNVVTVHDVGESHEGVHFVVMELLSGETLSAHMKRHKTLSLQQALHISSQLVQGMAAAEGVGLVHRDLKPDNIFLIDDDHVKILDFGLSTLRSAPVSPATHTPNVADTDPSTTLHDGMFGGAEDTLVDPMAHQSVDVGQDLPEKPPAGLTQPGAIVGTPRYMSPEQVLGWAVDHRSDLYSFGCILFEMLAGRSPFTGPNTRAYMHQHLYTPPKDLRKLAPELPEPVVMVVEKLLAKAPGERYSSWPELREALRGLQPQPQKTTALPVVHEQREEPLPAEPYRFLNAFSRVSRNIFYGREQDMERFMSLWRDPEIPPVLILTGASGVGKTSFLSARIMPRLEDANIWVLRVVGGENPVRALRSTLTRELARFNELVSAETDNAQLLNQILAVQDRPLAIVFDQLEEVFTSGTAENASELQADLAAMVAGGGNDVRFIVSLREDYLGTLLRTLHPLPIDQIVRTLPLRPLSQVDLLAALEGPSQPSHPVAYEPFRFEPGLTERIVADLLSDPAGEVAPRVQAVGARLWEMIRNAPEKVITEQHYTARLGGAQGILARLLDEAVEDMGTAEQGVAKELLRALTNLPGSRTSRPAPESELIAHADEERRIRTLRRLEDRWRVIQGFTDPRWPEERTYRITHETLVDRIQQYGEEGSSLNRARQLFHHGLTLWLKGGCLPEDLLPEHHFDAIQLHIEDLVLRSAIERQFYDACEERHDSRFVRKYIEQRRRRIQQGMAVVVLPLTFMILGVVLGQIPVHFISFHTFRVHTAIRMKWPNLDLRGAKLRHADFSTLDLRSVLLAGADLREASLNGSGLANVDLSNANLEEANLFQADLRISNLEGTRLQGANLRQADLRQAVFTGSDYENARFDGAIFSIETQWHTPDAPPPSNALGPNGQATGLRFTDQDLSNLDFFQLSAANADFRQSTFNGSTLIGADLHGASLQDANFSRAKMGKINLTDANLQGAILTQTSLVSAVARNANFEGAQLNGADLRDSDFRGTNLCGADLRNTNLGHVRMDGAEICESTRWSDENAIPANVVLRTEND